MPASNSSSRLVSLALRASQPSRNPQRRLAPNVLLIVSDDQAFSDFGFTGKDITGTSRFRFQQPRRWRLTVMRVVRATYVVRSIFAPWSSSLHAARPRNFVVELLGRRRFLG